MRRHQRTYRMPGGKLEGRRHLSLLGAVAHQSDVAAGAERQRKSIKQDGLAGAGLAGEHRQPSGKVDVEPVDEDDVTYREPGQHAWLLMHSLLGTHFGLTAAARSLPDVLTFSLIRHDRRRR